MRDLIVSKVCEIPEELKKSNSCSIQKFFENSGWLYLSPTVAELEEYFNEFPDLCDSWIQYSSEWFMERSMKLIFNSDRGFWFIDRISAGESVFFNKVSACANYVHAYFADLLKENYRTKNFKVCHLAGDSFKENRTIENLIRSKKLKKKDVNYDLMVQFFLYNPNVLEPWKKIRDLNPGKKKWELQYKDKNEMESLVLFASFYLKNIFFEIGQYHKPRLKLVDLDIDKKNIKINFKEIIFSSREEFDRFVMWIETSIAQGKVEELERIGKNKFKAFVHPFIKGHRYFRIKGDQQVWVLCSFEGPSKTSFQKYHPNLRYD